MTDCLAVLSLNVRDLFDYDPEAGLLVWKERSLNTFSNIMAGRQWNAKYAGKAAGNISRKRGRTTYRTVRIWGKRYGEHRVIWAWVTGEEPPEIIDHINRDATDNRWVNLREATHSLNSHNREASQLSHTGYRGVRLRRDGRYDALLGKNGRRIYIGAFDSAEAAHSAYLTAKNGAMLAEIALIGAGK